MVALSMKHLPSVPMTYTSSVCQTRFMTEGIHSEVAVLAQLFLNLR